ncbi:glycosyltransferase family 2 protein [Spirosoma rigui]|uniref:glycosyltransferase family 2 protein n=1 Tax=Spirosoma rigui TaxID=564064 RepID=UPI0009B04865|nr:glycosyltransferase [Spirosoma rigui]
MNEAPMSTEPTDQSPLVSVIIPCYNHAAFLQQAIDSIDRQTYAPIEIVVVDDGSVDHTNEVASQNQHVRYVYQHNQGLSAARNTGYRASQGHFLVFLDADDVLYPHAIAYNLAQLLARPDAAFVSGGHEGVDQQLNVLWTTQRVVTDHHYRHFLMGNYIGMHATVMYRRWVFDTYLFDSSLRACEDYQLYLAVSAQHPVLHHTNILTGYRQHGTNMSSDSLLMMTVSLSVLQQHEVLLRDEADRQAYKQGVTFWQKLYCQQMYLQLTSPSLVLNPDRRAGYVQKLRQNEPVLFMRYQLFRYVPVKSFLKRMLPRPLIKWLKQAKK